MLDWTSRPCTSPSCFRSSHYAFPSPAKVVIHGSGCATCQRGQRCSFRVWEQLLGKAVKESWWRRDLALTLRGAALAHGDIRCLDPLHCTEFRVSYHVCVGLQQLLGDAARGVRQSQIFPSPCAPQPHAPAQPRLLANHNHATW
ncbi:unnamed protein product [Closterium sp. NIES-65]|nr:unnamed protein product [Closterium sp. NIES-65]